MSSRLHNKWHRHNHHTNPTPDPNFPDSSHDPIASYDSPFQGDFVMSGTLSATQTSINPTGVFRGPNIGILASSPNISLSAVGTVAVNGALQANEVRFNTLRGLGATREFAGQVSNTGRFLPITVENQTFFIPLWQAI
jgi:hypothetical protein